MNTNDQLAIEPYLKPAEAAAFIGVGKPTITAWARAGKLPATPIGEGNGGKKSWRFKKSELEAWMQSRRAKHQEAA